MGISQSTERSKLFIPEGVDAAITQGSSPLESNPIPPTASALVLECYRQGLWQPTGSSLLNDKFTWDVMTRAGLWDSVGDGVKVENGQPLAATGACVDLVDESLLSKGFLDRMEAVDCISERGWRDVAVATRSELDHAFLFTYSCNYRGDDAAASTGPEMTPGVSVFESVMRARKALLLAAYAGVVNEGVARDDTSSGSPVGIPFDISSNESIAQVTELDTIPMATRLPLEAAILTLMSHVRYVTVSSACAPPFKSPDYALFTGWSLEWTPGRPSACWKTCKAWWTAPAPCPPPPPSSPSCIRLSSLQPFLALLCSKCCSSGWVKRLRKWLQRAAARQRSLPPPCRCSSVLCAGRSPWRLSLSFVHSCVA